MNRGLLRGAIAAPALDDVHERAVISGRTNQQR
jgi:hypothetical protein